MNQQITITISRDDADLLQNILLLARHAEVFLCGLHGVGNDGHNGLQRLDLSLKDARLMADNNAAISDMERQFDLN
jgi:hypothetical protein